MSDFWKNLLIAILVPFVVSSFTIASNYGTMGEKLDRIDRNQSAITTEIRALSDDVNTMKIAVSGLPRVEVTTVQLGEKVDNMNISLTQLRSDLTNTQNNASDLTGKVTKTQDLVVKVDKDVGILKTEVATANTNIADLQRKINK